MLLPAGGSLLAPSAATGSGQQQQKQLSLAARNAEALFEAKNVAEIRQVCEQHARAVPRGGWQLLWRARSALAARAAARRQPLRQPLCDTCHVLLACLRTQIEARTQQDIEEKNLQLRQLVGDSHRYVHLGAWLWRRGGHM